MNLKITYDKLLVIDYGLCIYIYALMQSCLIEISYIKWLFDMAIMILIFIAIILELRFDHKINIKQLIISIIFIIMISYSVVKNDMSNQIFLLAFYMFLFRKKDSKKIFKAFSLAIFSAIITILVLNHFEVIQSVIYYGNRDSLGFIYATFGANLFFHGVLSFIMWREEKVPLYVWIIILVCNHYFFVKTQTEAVYYMTIAIFVIYQLFRLEYIEKILMNHKLTIIIENMATIICVFTIIFQLLYNKYYYLDFFKNVNKLVDMRLSLGKVCFEKYDIKLFGQIINWQSFNKSKNQVYFYVDSSYLNILFNYGVLMLMLICLIINKLCKNVLKEKRIFCLLAILFLLIHSMTDPQLLSFRYDPFIVALFATNADRLTSNLNNSNITVGEKNEKI